MMAKGGDVMANITIVTVVRNAREYLRETIESVIPYCASGLEYIIIDGLSTDGTVDVIKEYEGKLAYWVSELDGGIYSAMNKGWEKAQLNSWVLFLGAGDRLISLPQLETLKENVVYFGNVQLGNDKLFKSKGDIRLRLGNTLHHQALLVPKRMHPGRPFDESYLTYADFDFNQRLLKMGVKFEFRDDLYSYAMPGGVSQKFSSEESLRVVLKNFGRLWVSIAYFYYLLQKAKNVL